MALNIFQMDKNLLDNGAKVRRMAMDSLSLKMGAIIKANFRVINYKGRDNTTMEIKFILVIGNITKNAG